MSSEVIVRTPDGREPGHVIIELQRALAVTRQDLVFAGERQKSRILLRTARGLDVQGRPFAPYSERGPYYYNPNGRHAGPKLLTDRQARSSAKRFAKRTGGLASGRSVRYDSYGAFKRALGRSNVDLMGAKAPHMLQALTIRAGQQEFTLGVYGEAATRAAAHNDGVPGRLPQREWLGVSTAEIEDIASDIANRLLARAGA